MPDTTFYGIEAIVDASGCDVSRFTRRDIDAFILELCERIDMNPALETYYWDEINGGACDDPHLKGVSAFRFIETSNIVIHTLTLIRAVFINIFSCKTFDPDEVGKFVTEYFSAEKIAMSVVERRYENL